LRHGTPIKKRRTRSGVCNGFRRRAYLLSPFFIHAES